jgi:hypothetical protein
VEGEGPQCRLAIDRIAFGHHLISSESVATPKRQQG